MVEPGSQYSWIMSIVLGQRSDCGTVFTSLTATVDVVTVMMQESAANQVLNGLFRVLASSLFIWRE